MKSLVIALNCIMLLAGAAFAREPSMRGQTQRDGTYGDPFYRASPNQSRNDARSTQGKANPSGKQEKKGPDPYDTRYGNQYNRPRY